MISLCMITKNNAATIERCISSVKQLVQEIIVGDTGSTDMTKSIAASLSAHVFDIHWNNNFSEAKNAVYVKATQPWILNLDADEVIALRDLQKIRALVQAADAEGYFLIQRNYTHQQGSFSWTSCKDDRYEESKVASGFVPRKMLRLFKNDKHIRAEGIVHDSVLPVMQRFKMNIKETDIPIHHFGLLNRKAEQTQYYIDIEKQHLKHDFFQEYQLASQLHSIGKLNEAAEHLATSLQLNPYFHLSTLELAIISMKKGKIAEAKPLLLQSLQLQEHPMAWSHLGIVYVHERNFPRAIECFEKALALNPRNADLHFNLAQALFEAGNIARARQEFTTAADLNSYYKDKIPHNL